MEIADGTGRWPSGQPSPALILFGEVEPGQIVIVDVEGLDPDAPAGSRAADDMATFTFRGEPKPVVVPDAPPVDMAKWGEE